ncbi:MULTISPECIES: hypothetical protein [unclassified Roseateles]|uniref:hypothetical protein n=1 Tax=unclassified Roseateles TaxID=2626991 RepID=UPI0008EA57F1|nr:MULTISPECIES: hypothetical protein [unclassified Roseateles]MDH0863636.1 hypothetical protein [Mitsuaria sp. GD03876]SFR92708.1 hypothetical protein SAMN05428960_3333 [Mitsuaria sp. PDC51]
MDEGWVSNLEVDCNESGRFVAVLVLTPPPELGPPIRVPIEGEYDRPELAEDAALDALAAMTRGD